MAFLKDYEIFALLCRIGDEEVDHPNDWDSEVEDILETDSEQPTDASSDSDDERLRTSNICRGYRINSSDSSNNEQLTKQMTSDKRQQTAHIIFPSTNILRGKNGHKLSAQPFEARNSRAVEKHSPHYSRTQE
ncbi:hypothetical protein EVAR_16920_1 [Eumeta japonica]|uniref:Uncharacterized protein n=1 Tax=Eumeta variegata TaxID=151549 RepID=A0A4C1TVE1_EUMVA|nr:hypothetical protein EVAR_16920_1 [Eumeta japonica]